MADAGWSRERYGEAFWRAYHESWQQSDLNQREYCEAHRLSLKAFGNWRAKFKAEPQLPPRKLLYRRGGLSQRLSHTLGHSLSHMTNGSPEPAFIIQRNAEAFVHCGLRGLRPGSCRRSEHGQRGGEGTYDGRSADDVFRLHGIPLSRETGVARHLLRVFIAEPGARPTIMFDDNRVTTL